ncbi:prephenate dehydratase [Ekhidna sp.]
MTKQKIAIQGLKGSFHHEAANHFFGNDIGLAECETFSEVMHGVTRGEVDHGLMAIENSTAGCIIPNYSLLRKNDVEVVGEVGLRVKLNLMTLEETSLDELEEAHSHQMAIRQCGNFFKDFQHIKLVEAFDTAGSAKMVRDKKMEKTAAIAGNLAAEEYGLKVIQAGIEDHELNYTRFLVIQKKGSEQVDNPNKVSVYFQTKHDPGSLSQVLGVISGLGINLGKLQSHPVPSKNSLYGFYATLEIQDRHQLEDLKRLMVRMTIQFEILGVYKKGETHG